MHRRKTSLIHTPVDQVSLFPRLLTSPSPLTPSLALYVTYGRGSSLQSPKRKKKKQQQRQRQRSRKSPLRNTVRCLLRLSITTACRLSIFRFVSLFFPSQSFLLLWFLISQAILITHTHTHIYTHTHSTAAMYGLHGGGGGGSEEETTR